MENKNKFNLTIKNFKTIKEIQLYMNSSSNNNILTLIGNNNAGKTNIIDAIHKIDSGKAIFDKSEYTHYIDSSIKAKPSIVLEMLFYDNDNKTNIPIKLSIDGKIMYNGIDEKYKNILEEENNLYISQLEKTRYLETGAYLMPNNATFDYKFRVNNFKHKIESSRSINNEEKSTILNIINSIERNIHFLNLDKKINIKRFIDIDIFKYTSINLSILDNDFLQQKDEWEKKQILDLWQKILGQNFNELLKDVSLKSERERKGIFEKYNKKFNKLINDIGSMIDYEFDYIFELSIQDNTFFVDIEEKNKNDKENYIWLNDPKNCGSGIKSIWSLIFWLSSFSDDEPLIILLDEPEKNLNPIYQKILAKWIEDKFKNKINQYIFYSTHSPFMILNNYYENSFFIERNILNLNETIVKKVWDTEGKATPNLIIDKNNEIRYLESLWIRGQEYKNVLFVEGITDWNVISNISSETFIIILFGENFDKILGFHLPYLLASKKKYKLLVDNDETGRKIINYFNENTSISENDIKTYYDFFKENDLEHAILIPWFNKNTEFKYTKNKKINSIIFHDNNNKIDQYLELKQWIEGK